VVVPNQQLRHSPEKTQRKAVRGTNEIERSPNCGVRRVPCFFPFTNGLHALCQLGPFTEICTSWMTRSMFEEERSLNKSCTIGSLPGMVSRRMYRSTSRRKPQERAYRFQFGFKSGGDDSWIVSDWFKVQFGAWPTSGGSVARDQRLTHPQMV